MTILSVRFPVTNDIIYTSDEYLDPRDAVRKAISHMYRKEEDQAIISMMMVKSSYFRLLVDYIGRNDSGEPDASRLGYTVSVTLNEAFMYPHSPTEDDTPFLATKEGDPIDPLGLDFPQNLP